MIRFSFFRHGISCYARSRTYTTSSPSVRTRMNDDDVCLKIFLKASDQGWGCPDFEYDQDGFFHFNVLSQWYLKRNKEERKKLDQDGN